MDVDEGLDYWHHRVADTLAMRMWIPRTPTGSPPALLAGGGPGDDVLLTWTTETGLARAFARRGDEPVSYLVTTGFDLISFVPPTCALLVNQGEENPIFLSAADLADAREAHDLELHDLATRRSGQTPEAAAR